jgi:hypothetical protein
MNSIIKGNLNNDIKKSPEKRGWFIGHFINKNSIFYNNEFEVRWALHKKGEKKKFPAKTKTAKTISILIKGKFLIKFPKNNENIVLSNQGDYVFWDSNVYHSSEALVDSTILTIRWPSLPNDLIKLFKDK